MKFSAGVTTLMAAATVGGAFAFAPSKVNGVSSPLKSTAEGTETYTFTKSEEIFAEAIEVRRHYCRMVWFRMKNRLPIDLWIRNAASRSINELFLSRQRY